MFKNLSILKSYYKLSNIKFTLILFEFVLLLIPSILSIISPILTANIISSITVYDFDHAKMLLIFDFLIIIISTILYFVCHFVSSNISKKILFNVNELIYESIKNNKNLSRIDSSTMTDIWKFSNFNNSLLYKICFLIKSIIILIIIFTHNAFISISIIVVSLISAFLISLTNKQIQKNNIKLTESKTKSLELFNNIQKGISLDTESYMENTMKYKYLDMVETSIKTNNKISLFYNLNNNFVSLILKTSVFLFTFYLISLVKSTYLSLSLFLILTPYLTSSAQNLIEFFEIFPEIALIENTLNGFNKFYKNNNIEKPSKNNSPKTYELQFSNANLNQEKYSIKNFSLQINYKDIVQFIGNENSGKRAIFDLIMKKDTAESGSVLLGNININNFSNETYLKYVSATYKSPFFYNISILENLLVTCNSKSKILKRIEEFDFNYYIDSLPQKINTIIDDKIPEKILFFIGILRVSLIVPKIFCIYEIPNNLDKHDKTFLAKVINILNKHSTIILFLHEKITNIKNSKCYNIINSQLISSQQGDKNIQ